MFTRAPREGVRSQAGQTSLRLGLPCTRYCKPHVQSMSSRPRGHAAPVVSLASTAWSSVLALVSHAEAKAFPQNCDCFYTAMYFVHVSPEYVLPHNYRQDPRL